MRLKRFRDSFKRELSENLVCGDFIYEWIKLLFNFCLFFIILYFLISLFFKDSLAGEFISEWFEVVSS